MGALGSRSGEALRLRKRTHMCRQCARAPVVRDMTTGWREQWLRILTGRRPYRCLDCGRRFFERPVRNSATPLRGEIGSFRYSRTGPIVASYARAGTQ